MASKRKRSTDDAGPPADAGNAGSGEHPAPAPPWTAEEMAAAKPLPMPTGDAAANVLPLGVPHAGSGGTTPAGRPEDEAAR